MRKSIHYTLQIIHLLDLVKTRGKITVISTFCGSLLDQLLDLWAAHSLYKLLAFLCSHFVKKLMKNRQFWWHLWKTSK